MPYFSFCLKKKLFTKNNDRLNYLSKIDIKIKYFSKDIHLWNFLRKIDNSDHLDYVEFEKRQKLNDIGNQILFCLPPNIGFGDAIEYALSIKAIINSKKYKSVGVAFVDKYDFVFFKFFNIYNIYKKIISHKEMNKYDTIFHPTLEIKELKFQKYIRNDIETLITKKFNLPQYRTKKIPNINKKNTIKSITIFPISQSPIRSMSSILLNSLIDHYSKDFKINIIFDDNSKISQYLEKNISQKNFHKIMPVSLVNLCNEIEKIEFGIFIDSGPLHLAKILNKKGVLIATTVNHRILLNKFDSINTYSSVYASKYCKAPCGLTNIFNYNNNVGCYDSLKILNKKIYSSNLNTLQRGSLKEEYLNFMLDPVGCIKNIDISKLIVTINNTLKN